MALLADLGERLPVEGLASWAQGSGRKAILTRTNLEAFQLWALCERQGIHAELWRGAAGNYWPGWIARLVLGFKQDVMPVDLLEQRWLKTLGPLVRISFDEALAFLAREGVFADGRLDLVQLNRAVGGGSPAAVRRTTTRLTISTIHRSKGLEFDEVLLYSPRQNSAGTAGEVRIIYVAATRAKKNFRILDKSQTVNQGARNSTWLHLRTNHFHIRNYSQQLFGILVDGAEEVDCNGHLKSIPPDELRAVASYVWEQAGAGVPRNVEISSPGEIAVPGVFLGGRRIASITPELNSDFRKIAQWQSRTFDKCAGLQLVDLATHAHDIEDRRARDAFGAACLGLNPVLSGIATIHTR